MNVEISAGAIVFRIDRKNDKIIRYLLLKHTETYWSFPKGNIEKGESLIETVKREIKEETGINDLKFVKNFKETIQYFYFLNNVKIFKKVIFFLAETNTNDVKISYEHIGYKWATYSEALKLLSYDNMKKILKKAHKRITKSLLYFLN
ncbi:MAG: bis(5'-nucleosyl)-tetraphosphatase [Candidatus Helarchaeota archaeon]